MSPNSAVPVKEQWIRTLEMLVFQWPPQNLPIPGPGPRMLQLEDWMSPTTVTAAFWLACTLGQYSYIR
jgi:hypothetical protein